MPLLTPCVARKRFLTAPFRGGTSSQPTAPSGCASWCPVRGSRSAVQPHLVFGEPSQPAGVAHGCLPRCGGAGAAVPMIKVAEGCALGDRGSNLAWSQSLCQEAWPRRVAGEGAHGADAPPHCHADGEGRERRRDHDVWAAQDRGTRGTYAQRGGGPEGTRHTVFHRLPTALDGPQAYVGLQQLAVLADRGLEVSRSSC